MSIRSQCKGLSGLASRFSPLGSLSSQQPSKGGGLSSLVTGHGGDLDLVPAVGWQMSGPTFSAAFINSYKGCIRSIQGGQKKSLQHQIGCSPMPNSANLMRLFSLRYWKGRGRGWVLDSGGSICQAADMQLKFIYIAYYLFAEIK